MPRIPTPPKGTSTLASHLEDGSHNLDIEQTHRSNSRTGSRISYDSSVDMSHSRSFGCRLSGLFGASPPHCQGAGSVSNSKNSEGGVEERGGTDPYGQYTQTVNGQVETTGAVIQLPLTYYGPSIPLGTGWVYGGSTSPALEPTPTTEQSLPIAGSTASTTSTVDITDPVDSGATSQLISSESSVPTLATNPGFPDPSADSSTALDSATAPSLATGATATSAASSGFAISSTIATPSSVVSSLSSSISSSSPSSSSSSSSSGSASIPHPSPSASGTQPSDGDNDLVPLLPAILVPLVIALALLVLVVLCYRRRRRIYPSTSTPPRWIPPWLATAPYPTTSRGYTPTNPPSTPPPKVRSGSLPIKSPDEKSALLPGFTPHHHRNSSSISRVNVEQDDELAELASQNQSLLQRLTLGLGWLTPSDPGRKPSGNVLERGIRRSSYTALPVPPLRTRRSGTATTGSGATGGTGAGGNANGSQTNDTASASNGIKTLTDEQLFFRPPAPTPSSGSSTRSSSGSRAVGANRQSWLSGHSQPPLPEGAAPPHWNQPPSDSISLGVSVTPKMDTGGAVLASGDGDLGEFGRTPRYRTSGERMRFPVPPTTPVYGVMTPGGTFGQAGPGGNREGGISSASFHTAQSELEQGALAVAAINRQDSSYRHVPLSAFGSHPSTPATTLANSSQDHSSSSNHDRAGGSPSPVHPTALAAGYLSPFGPAPTSPISPVSGQREGREGVKPEEAITRLQALFALTPPNSAGLEDNSAGRGRMSFPGQPLVDMRLTRDSKGERVEQVVGEFGEPLRTGPDVSPVVHSGPSVLRDQSSETASIYSQPSAARPEGASGSGGSHASHGSSERNLATAVSDRAVRGKRSKQQLLKVPSQASLRAATASGDVPPVPPVPEAMQMDKELPVRPAGGKWLRRFRGP